PPPPGSPLFPYTTLFRSRLSSRSRSSRRQTQSGDRADSDLFRRLQRLGYAEHLDRKPQKSSRECGYSRRRLESASRRILVGSSSDRKSTRLNSSHVAISY